MISYIYADTLAAHPALKSSMLQDRRIQFQERQNWEVRINSKGEEIDEYDAMNPLYVICHDGAGRHMGSMRFLPTVGKTMVNDHFTHLSGGGTITSPLIWECTRFCISPSANNAGQIAAKLMLAGCEMGLQFGLTHSIGVFDARMVRIYRRIGWTPEIIGSAGDTYVGLWAFSSREKAALIEKSGVSQQESAEWFEYSFLGEKFTQSLAA